MNLSLSSTRGVPFDARVGTWVGNEVGYLLDHPSRFTEDVFMFKDLERSGEKKDLAGRSSTRYSVVMA